MLVLIRENRCRPAWLIWLPVFVVFALWGMFCQVLGIPSSSIEHFGLLISTVVLSLAVLWLAGGWLGRFRGVASFFLAFLLMAFVGIIGIFSNFSFQWDRNATPCILVYSISVFVLLLAIALTRRCCRKKFGAKRFMLFLLLWIPVFIMASILVYMGIFVIFEVNLRRMILMVLFQVVISSSVFGIGLYLILLPFMILAFRSGFYRRRLEGCLNLPAPAADRGNPVTAEPENVGIDDIT